VCLAVAVTVAVNLIIGKLPRAAAALGPRATALTCCSGSGSQGDGTMLTPDEYSAGIDSVRALAAGGADLDSVVGRLKELGFSPIECIKAVMELTGRPLREATEAVHFSPAWPELRA
jgi:hypothetical protein